jgi:hypothetical protein
MGFLLVCRPDLPDALQPGSSRRVPLVSDLETSAPLIEVADSATVVNKQESPWKTSRLQSLLLTRASERRIGAVSEGTIVWLLTS